MKIKVSEAIGAQLDGMVAKCEGEEFRWQPEYNSIGMEFEAHHYSTDWSQGGPIIEEGAISLCPDEFITGDTRWCAVCTNEAVGYEAFGPTPLIAAMRCYVASKLGDEVEVPSELIS